MSFSRSSHYFLALIIISAWNVLDCTSIYHEPNMLPGRTTIVHLFEWKWNDIAIECEQFLGPYEYGGVQVSPPNENAVIYKPFYNQNVTRPWYERYQPVSYKLFTRSGNETQFRDMVRRCNNAGVRIYVDIVVNHMTGQIGKSCGTGGSSFDSSIPKYDGVPYGPENFNGKDKCPTASGDIEDYNDPVQLRNCRLGGLEDLDQSQEYVREKIVRYLNKLIHFGVAGFRMDAAKHMWPHDLKVIYSRLQNLNEVYFGPGIRPFIYQEVTDLDGKGIDVYDYTAIGRVTEFRFGKNLGDIVRKKSKKQLKSLHNFGEGWAFLNNSNAFTFVDNHDNQRQQDNKCCILTFREPRMYKIAVAFMLAWPYGVPRVMSSFNWSVDIGKDGKDKNYWIGPPHDENYNTKDVKRNPDLTCSDVWVCEHRWPQIRNMVKFRNVAGTETVKNWWDNGSDQIAFGRSNKAFLAINNENKSLNQSLQTGLPQGTYCDVITGIKIGNRCSGRIVRVDGSGKARITLAETSQEPMIAIHVDEKL